MSKTGALEVKISVTDTDKVETLINLLAKYQDDLPSELLASLKELADCDACELNHKTLLDMGVDARSVCVLINDVKARYISSVNPVLKRVTFECHDKSGGFIIDGKKILEKFAFPKSLSLKTNSGMTICEWG